MRAVVHHTFGPPDVLVPAQLAVPQPSADEVLLRVLAVSVDYVQLHLRRGGSGRIGSAREPGYGLSAPPYVRGGTVCGEVVALGSDVDDVAVGSRHLVGGLRPGSYVEYGVLDAAALHADPEGRIGPTAVPEGFTAAEAAAFNYAPVAYHTLRVAAGLSAGETVLIHAAAGGTGVLAVQLAKSFGARVVATAGGPAKVALVRELGADVVIDYRTEDFVPAVLAATGGRGVDVVWETVGGDVFARSLECMAEGGRMVSFRVQQLQRRGPGGLLSLLDQEPAPRRMGWREQRRGAFPRDHGRPSRTGRDRCATPGRGVRAATGAGGGRPPHDRSARDHRQGRAGAGRRGGYNAPSMTMSSSAGAPESRARSKAGPIRSGSSIRSAAMPMAPAIAARSNSCGRSIPR